MVEDALDWNRLEDWLMTVDTSELINFCGPMGIGISFERNGSALECYPMPAEHKDIFKRVFAARARDILLYIDTGGVSSEVPTSENAVKKAEQLFRTDD
jgi:hypothetical protein